MTVLAGPFAIATAVLALGGVLKMVEPADTAHALSVKPIAIQMRSCRIGGSLLEGASYQAGPAPAQHHRRAAATRLAARAGLDPK
jgi:hypothetical protein